MGIPDRSRMLAIGSLLAIGIGATAPNLGNRYAQDDLPVIAQNPIIHSLAKPWTAFTEPYWPKPFPPELYRPMATTGFIAQWAIGGGEPWVFRVVSNLMYIGAGLALYRLAALLLPGLAAWLVAAFFLAHPVHVEAVAAAVNQSELMVGLLSLLAVTLYVRVRRHREFQLADGAKLFGLYFLAALFKESGLVLIGLLVAAELTVIESGVRFRARLAQVRPFLLVMLLGAVTFLAIRTSVLHGDAIGTFTAEGIEGLTMGQRALTMLSVVPYWFRLLFWPAHLQIDYSPQEINAATTWGPDQTAGALLLGVALVVLIVSRRRAPVIAFGILWTAIGLFPVSNVLVPTGIVLAERTLFLASIGAMLIVGGMLAPVIDVLRKANGTARGLAIAAAAAVLVMGVTRSASRQRVWKDPFTLWSQATIDAPLSYRVHHAMAQLLFAVKAKRFAEREFKAAMMLYPGKWGAAFDFANKLRLEGKCDPAVHYYRKTLMTEPALQPARTGLIACLLYLGRYGDAKAEAQEGLSYANGRMERRGFRKIFIVADSAQKAKAPPATVRLTMTAADTLP